MARHVGVSIALGPHQWQVRSMEALTEGVARKKRGARAERGHCARVPAGEKHWHPASEEVQAALREAGQAATTNKHGSGRRAQTFPFLCPGQVTTITTPATLPIILLITTFEAQPPR